MVDSNAEQVKFLTEAHKNLSISLRSLGMSTTAYQETYRAMVAITNKIVELTK